MVERHYATELDEYFARWLASQDTTWDWLEKSSEVASGTGSHVREGTIPRPPTLVKLARVMGVSPGTLLLLAGHVSAQDLAEPVSGIAPEEEALLSMYRKLRREYQQVVLGVTQRMLQFEGGQAPHGSE